MACQRPEAKSEEGYCSPHFCLFSQSGTLVRVMGLGISSHSFRVALPTSLKYSWKLLPRNRKMCFIVIFQLLYLAPPQHPKCMGLCVVAVLWHFQIASLFENDKHESGWEIGKM